MIRRVREPDLLNDKRARCHHGAFLEALAQFSSGENNMVFQR